MKFAILGGTHGNELVGIEVMNLLKKSKPIGCQHDYDTFLANPKATELQRRFVDSDLNRCFGLTGVSRGYEAQRSQELKNMIVGSYDFLLDLHTTTTHMGLTLILNNNDETSIKAACYLQEKIPEIKIITTLNYNEKCPYTNAMVKSGLTVEVGGVAHNVIRAELVFSIYKMVEILLSWDFQDDIDFTHREYYQVFKNIEFPIDEHFYIHPELENRQPFEPLIKGDPLFININNEVILYTEEQVIYPFFINEAAYQNEKIAMSVSLKKVDLTNIMDKKS